MTIPTADQLLILMQANQIFLTPPDAADVQSDGWVSTGHLSTLLHGQYPIANPMPAVTVPRPFGVADVMGVVSPANRGKLMSSPAIGQIQQAINSQDRVAIGFWGQLCVDGGLITTEEQAAIMGVLSATVTDPNWPSIVTGPSLLTANGYESVDISLINQALGRVQ